MISGLLERAAIFLAATGLPATRAHRLAAEVGRARYRRAAYRGLARLRETVRSRLGVSESETEAVVQAVIERDAVERLEGGLFRFKPRRRVRELVRLEGLEALDEALARGKGCIVYSGHFRGRWSFFAALGLRGYRPLVIRQNAPATMSGSERWFQLRFDRMFTSKFECNFLWMETPTPFSGAAAAAHLRKNGVLITMIDIASYTQRVVDVDFLRRKEKFPVGAVLLSQLTGAPLLDFVVRYDAAEGRYVATFGATHFPPRDPTRGTQELAIRLEASIRMYPGDWAGWEKSQYLGTG